MAGFILAMVTLQQDKTFRQNQVNLIMLYQRSRKVEQRKFKSDREG